MTRTMYDSVNPAAIPTGAQLVAGYVSGRWAWTAANWARFPNSVHVTIATAASVNNGVVLDVEQGDATPAQAPGWVTMRRAAGVDPTVYCSASTWASVIAAFTNARTPQPHYWIAAYPGGGPTLPALSGIQAVAHQYADPTTSGGDYDLSIVADHWPGVDQETDMTPEQDQMLRDIHEQLYGGGSRGVGNPDGWPLLQPSLPGADYTGPARTPIDFIREIHREVCQRLPNRVDGKSTDTVAGYSANGDAYGYRILAAVAGLPTALAKEETDILAAINGITTGAVDIPTLASAIVSTLPAQLAPADAAALLAALKTQLDK